MVVALQDIASRTDIERLVDGFYARVQTDAVLGPIFNGVAATDWARHLPKMYAFWDGVLFATPGFRGNPLAVHLALGKKVELGQAEFDRWLTLFHETVNELFAGPMADEAKARAMRIAAVMQHHLSGGAGVRLGRP
jgi:hemoglobin